MQKNSSIYDSIDDIIGFLNEGNKNFNGRTPKDAKDSEIFKTINEKSMIEEQFDSLSEFQMNYEEENKKKKEIVHIIPQMSGENFFKNANPNDSFSNPCHNK